MEKPQLRFPDWSAAGMALLGGLFLTPLLYVAPLVGWDWYVVYFQNKESLFWYPPWTSILTAPLALTLPWRLGLAASNALTLSALAIATLRESGARTRWGYVGALMAVVSPPVVVLLWAGQVDGWGLIGYMLLPWAVPLLIIKPTVAAFALFARRSWFLAALAFAAITLLLWPSWPSQAIGIHVEGDYPHVASMGWFKLGWPIGILGLLLMLFTNRKDPLHLIAAGGFLMPYVFPYHFVFLLPVLGRFRYFQQLLLWISIWIMSLPFMLGPQWALVSYLFPLLAWFLIWRASPPEDTWLAALHQFAGRLRTKFS